MPRKSRNESSEENSASSEEEEQKHKSSKKKRQSSSEDSSSSSSSASDSEARTSKKKCKKQKKSKKHKKHGDKRDDLSEEGLPGKSTKRRADSSIWDSPGATDDRFLKPSSRRDVKKPEREWDIGKPRLEDNRDEPRRVNRRDENESNRFRDRSREDRRNNRDRRDDSRNDRRSPPARDRDNRRNHIDNHRRNINDNRSREDEFRSSHNERRTDNNRGDNRRKRSHSNDRQDNRNRNEDQKPFIRKQRRNNDLEEDKNYDWGKRSDGPKEDVKPVDKEKPNFGLSGKLTEETNTVHGIVIKYAEPPEARKPKRRWRFYPFKGETTLPTLYLHRQSAFLIGRDRKVCDVAVDHPSCSKQHAALQYRLIPYDRDDGSKGKRVRPYIIDLESANGTFVNNKQIESKKYVELLEKDVIKFGFSSREYVLLHENSKDEQEDDDVLEVENEVQAEAV